MMGGTFIRNAGKTGTLELHCIYHCFIFYHIDYFQTRMIIVNIKIFPEKMNM